MGYVIVNVKSRIKVKGPGARQGTYSSKGYAEAALRRLQAQSKDPEHQNLITMECEAYRAQVPMVEVTNLMTGKKVWESADTPWGCSVASETYWCS